MKKLTKADTSKIIVDFQRTGINEIDIPETVKQWSRLWGIYQWKDEYRVIKSLRKDSPICVLKLTISYQQAKELIQKLRLTPMNGTFRSAITWKRYEDWKFQQEYSRERARKRAEI